jgi:DNA-binding cell septation regulator SpoVG
MKSKITEIQIAPIKPRDGLVAFVSFVYDGNIFLGSMGLYTRPQGGYRITYPLRKNTEKDLNIYFPVNRDVAQAIEEMIGDKYEELVVSSFINE